MGDIPTVKIKNPVRGFAIINESDFDPKVHELFDAPKDEKEVVTAELDRRGIEYDGRLGVAKLRALLEAR